MPAKLQVKDNFGEVSRQFNRFRKKFPKELDGAFRGASGEVVKRLQELTPTRTTKLRNSYIIKRIRNFFYEITNNAKNKGFEYIDALEFGTGLFGPKKRRIRPKGKKALRFVDRGRRSVPKLGVSARSGSGKVVFARSVKGIKPYRMFKTVEKNVTVIVNIFLRARLRAILRRFNVLSPAVR